MVILIKVLDLMSVLNFRYQTISGLKIFRIGNSLSEDADNKKIVILVSDEGTTKRMAGTKTTAEATYYVDIAKSRKNKFVSVYTTIQLTAY